MQEFDTNIYPKNFTQEVLHWRGNIVLRANCDSPPAYLLGCPR
jgi:hypothetical protein